MAKRLADNARMPEIVQGWMWPYGWLVVLWDDRNGKHYMHLPPGTTYAEATEVRDEEMASGLYEKAWLIQKSAQKEK